MRLPIRVFPNDEVMIDFSVRFPDYQSLFYRHVYKLSIGYVRSLTWPSDRLIVQAVNCLEGDNCKIRGQSANIEEDLDIDTSIACDSCDGLQMILPDEEPVKDDEDHLEKDVIVVDDDSSGEEDDNFLITIVSSKFKNSN
ncbi:hypothetical protein L1987_23547 [Smallanthus sonchifolius]|uniref:Uncharacterized protein n=1 Tax=Smallanthus sonchifolius TaxID=185202 RepID=A0ACB9IJF9_9ASTR|nr:hypothetical protein L1987_23547 [Smallanthus sonchifolius]